MKTDGKEPHVDSPLDRIEKAFFSPEPGSSTIKPALKPKRSKTAKKPRITRVLIPPPLPQKESGHHLPLFITLGISAVVIAVIYLSVRDKIYFIPQICIPPQNKPAEISASHFTAQDHPVIAKRNEYLIPLSSLAHAAGTIDFKSPVNLAQNYLWVPSRALASGLTARLYFKDTGFHSNKFAPVEVTLPTCKGPASGVIVDVSGSITDPTVDIQKITQIKIEFQNTTKSGTAVFLGKKWGTIKK